MLQKEICLSYNLVSLNFPNSMACRLENNFIIIYRMERGLEDWVSIV